MKKKINPTLSSFEALIEEKSLYVDKTKYLYELIGEQKQYYFCSRPRRFGKTLTIYTLEAIFKGKRELFKGLYIDKTDYDWKEYPVIHIDFGLADDSTAKGIESWINDKLIAIGKGYGVELKQDNVMKLNFELLIEELSKQAKVVVLIDEYDKPLSSNIYNPEVEGIRDVLRGFFEVLKASPDYIRFVFITGVTKYAKVSIFSSMNNLMDISMTKQYANMFGYTQEELETNFKEYIDDGCKATGMTRNDYLTRLKKKYDGYCFFPNTETVYNPVSIGMFFAQGGEVFNDYWMDTGGTKLLYDIAKKSAFDISVDVDEVISVNNIRGQDIVELTTGRITKYKYKSLLFQAGYLTIRKQTEDGKFLYLDFPNEEVSEAFSLMVLPLYIGDDANDKFENTDMLSYLRKGDMHSFIEIMKSIFASIPNTILGDYEYSFHAGFYCMLKALGANINAEVNTNKGRIDAVLKCKEHIYIIEFKMDKSAEEALNQIKDRAYYEQYSVWKKTHTVHLVGIGFSTQNRNISSYQEEIL